MSDTHRERSWQRGKAAALAGKAATVCRTAPGTIYYDDWHDGHAEGLRVLETMPAAELVNHLTIAEQHALRYIPLSMVPYSILPAGLRQTLFARGILEQVELPGGATADQSFMSLTDRGRAVCAAMAVML